MRKTIRPGGARADLVLVCLLGLFASGDARLWAAEPIRLQLQWQPQAQFAGYMVAKDRGFFAKAGLEDVQIQWATDGSRTLERLASGKTDFCTSWLSDGIVERADGKPVVLISQIILHSSMALVVRADSGIKKPADITGHRVGLWGGPFDIPPTALFKKLAVRPIAVPQSGSMVPFLRGAVDVASAMQYNEYHELLEAGMRPKELRVFLLADHGIDFPEDGLYCTQTTRRDRPKICAAMVRAIDRGWAYALLHEDETLDLVMKHCREANVKTNRNHQRWMLRAMGRIIETGRKRVELSEKTYDSVTGILLGEELIPKIPAFDEFYQPPSPENRSK